MIVQGLPALVSLFIPTSVPVFTDVRVVAIGPNAQVQIKVVG